jgi:tRNA pseudouridine38-40 synthase
VRTPLHLEAMRAAARHLVGCHDFACFETRPESPLARPGRSTVRRLDRVELQGAAGAEIHLEIEGSGFLRHMVRAIAGTLLEVGRGRRAPESLPALLAARDRRRAGPTAPARGLTLVRLLY